MNTTTIPKKSKSEKMKQYIKSHRKTRVFVVSFLAASLSFIEYLLGATAVVASIFVVGVLKSENEIEISMLDMLKFALPILVLFSIISFFIELMPYINEGKKFSEEIVDEKIRQMKENAGGEGAAS